MTRAAPLPEDALAYLHATRPHARRDLWQLISERPGVDRPGEQLLIPRGRAAAYLHARNDLGMGAYVALSDFETPRRLIENVTHVHHIWIDLDGAPLPPSWPLEPHAIVNTSPGKYQAIWRVTALPQPPDAESRDLHNRLITALAHLYGGDARAQGINRVLRVPGYLHQKRDPYLVQLVAAGEHRAWTLDEVLAAWPPLRDAAAPPPPRAVAPRAIGNASAYALAALSGEAELVANAPEGARNATLAARAFCIGTLAGTGALDPDVAIETMVAAAMQAGLPEHEARTTAERQVKAGMTHPRDVAA